MSLSPRKALHAPRLLPASFKTKSVSTGFTFVPENLDELSEREEKLELKVWAALTCRRPMAAPRLRGKHLTWLPFTPLFSSSAAQPVYLPLFKREQCFDNESFNLRACRPGGSWLQQCVLLHPCRLASWRTTHRSAPFLQMKRTARRSRRATRAAVKTASSSSQAFQSSARPKGAAAAPLSLCVVFLSNASRKPTA